MEKNDYLYGNIEEPFLYYKTPKVLYEGKYKSLTVEAKGLYGIFLDRASLSVKNKWFDEKGRVYIIFTIEELKNIMQCGENKVEKLLKELKNLDLIESKRMGLGIPNRIYVKNFLSSLPKRQVQTLENQTVRDVNFLEPDLPNSQTNNTNLSITEFNNTEDELIYPSIHLKTINNYEAQDFEKKRELLATKLDMEILLENYPDDKFIINMIFQIIFDTLNSTMKSFRISGGSVPAEIVKSRLLSLNHMHIEYVMACLRKTTTKINNLPGYVLTSLYQAPSTMDAYYRNLVQHDLYGKRG